MKMCKVKEQGSEKKTVREVNEENEDEEEQFFIGAVGSQNEKEEKIWSETIEFYNKVRITFKLDTGPQTNLIPKCLFEKFQNVSITKSFVKLLNYDGHVINHLGKVTLECNVVSKPEKVRLEFFIVANNKNASAILGLEACQKFNLIKRINAVELDTILNEFSDVFKGIGCVQRKHTIRVEKTEPL